MKLKSVANAENAGLVEYHFFCPGCNRVHRIPVSGASFNWKFDNNFEKPSFHPSLKITYDYLKVDEAHTFCCHSIIAGGNIKFCADSTHELGGKTVPMPDWPYDE